MEKAKVLKKKPVRNKSNKKKPSSRAVKQLAKEHPLSSSEVFTSREIGWLNFNRRVLSEASDLRNPLLERVRFLSISASNLDEFYMKRVGRIKKKIDHHVTSKSTDGKTPQEQFDEIRSQIEVMIKDQSQLYKKILKPELAKENIHLLDWKNLTGQQKKSVTEYFIKNVFPLLTPLSVDPGHPFPFISNLSTSLGVRLKHPDREEMLFARVKIPKVLPQWIRVPTEDLQEFRFVHLMSVIQEHLGELFPSMIVQHVMPFRLTRTADTDQEDIEETDDLLETIEEEIKQRKFADVIRLEHGPKPDNWMLKFLIDELELQKKDVFESELDLDFTDLNFIADLNISRLRFSHYAAPVPNGLFVDDPNSFFAMLRKHDFLVHSPYESFSASVEKMIRLASEDPKVLAIKMTLYRTGDKSPIVKSLIRAAEEGKQVVCLVELKARFDEERNIFWAQALENAGVHVIYGVVGLKTHAKTTLIIRQEPDGLKTYAHIGTGNYNVATAKFYTDLGLLTSNSDITNDLVNFFHFLTGRSLKANYEKLLIAPVNMFLKFKSLIEREKENATKGLPAQIIAKFNNMEENDIGMELYKASQKGVNIDLIVRGFCCMKPGVPKLSENIRVVSIIGRYLEHSRIFYFRNGQTDPLNGDFFIGSADWMYRNLHSRIEAITPILDRQNKEKCWELLQVSLKDQRQAWDMQSDGQYVQRKGDDSTSTHSVLMSLTTQRARAIEEDVDHITADDGID